MIDKFFGCSGSFIDDIIEISLIYFNKESNLSSEKEIATASPDKIISLVGDELTYDNSFSAQLKTLAYKIFGFYDEVYNKEGVIKDTTPFFKALEVVFGNHEDGTKGMYDLKPLKNFLYALLEPVEKEQTAHSSNAVDSAITSSNADDKNLSLSLQFFRSLFISYDDRESTLLMLFKHINLEMSDGKPIDMNSVLEELTDVLDKNSLDPSNNPDFYNPILNLLEMAANNFQVL